MLTLLQLVHNLASLELGEVGEAKLVLYSAPLVYWPMIYEIQED